MYCKNCKCQNENQSILTPRGRMIEDSLLSALRTQFPSLVFYRQSQHKSNNESNHIDYRVSKSVFEDKSVFTLIEPVQHKEVDLIVILNGEDRINTLSDEASFDLCVEKLKTSLDKLFK